METKRRIRKNDILVKLKTATNFISRSEETISRLHKSGMGEVYTKSQIDKLNTTIKDKYDIIDILNNDLEKISMGGMDNDINDEYKRNHTKNVLDKEENDRIKKEKKEEKAEKKSVSKKYWNAIITASRGHRRKERDYKYGYKYFNSVIDTLPSYMARNLAEMPNNKGYIWRGVHFYGELPEEKEYQRGGYRGHQRRGYRNQKGKRDTNSKPGPRVLFEKKRGGLMIIHEYTDKEYIKYEKRGRDRKQLVHRELKRIKKNQGSLLDYVKK